MRTTATPAAAVVLLAMLVATPPASADEQISAGPPNRYITTDVTIDQGERVTFSNSDAVEHDVLARDQGPDGKPLFRSALIGFGETAPVKGVEYLTTGSYRFLCSIHPQMEGTLNVSSAGTPAPRPEPKPSFELRILDSKIAKVRKRRALRVRVTTNGAATVRMKARAKGKAFAKGKTKLTAAGAKTVKLRLTRAGRRLVARSRRTAVRVGATATHEGGEKTKQSAKTTLR